jgi:sugar phosphate permease
MYLVQAKNFGEHLAANITPMVFWGMAIGGPLMGWLSDVLKRRRIITQIGLFLITIIFACIIYIPDLTSWQLGALCFMLGLAASPQVLVFVVAVELTSKNISGTATACTNFLVMLIVLVCNELIGHVLQSTWDGHYLNGAHAFSQTGFQMAFFILVCMMLLSLVGSFFLEETHPLYAGEGGS